MIPVKEDLLHFIWKYNKLPLAEMLTSGKEPVRIKAAGTHNHLAGPDFFNAQVFIGDQLWAGNVEIHLKSSDWYAHHHEKDTNYNNVILHVVWEDDATVFRSDNSEIPTLQLKDHISSELLSNYEALFDKRQKSFINCEKNMPQIDGFLFRNWLERLFIERLERKSNLILEMLSDSKNDWEQVLFKLLLKGFGLKINGPAFLSLGQQLNFSVVRKVRAEQHQLESIFLGMSHLLGNEIPADAYQLELKKEYDYLKHKFDLDDSVVQKPEFFKLRPPNFPTIRLSQLADLYCKQENLFSKLMTASSLEDLYLLFEAQASGYWDDHFTFGKTSRKRVKKLTKEFIALQFINVLIPLKFCYSKAMGKEVSSELVAIARELKSEQNTVINSFVDLKVPSPNAHSSQALLQLYTAYCSKNKCLQCAVGSSLVR